MGPVLASLDTHPGGNCMRWWLLLVPLTAAAPVAAQDTLPGLPPGYAIGATLDYYLVDDLAVPAVSARGTGLAARRWTPAFGLGALLDQSEARFTALSVDLGTAYNQPVRGAHLLVEAGATSLFAVAEGTSATYVGGYLGVGAIVRVANGLGLRLGVSRRWFMTGDGPVGVSLVSVGITALPRAAAPPP